MCHDGTVMQITDANRIPSYAVFPSNSNSKSMKSAVIKYIDLVKNEDELSTWHLIRFDDGYSVIRIYMDIFMAYNTSTRSWVIFRLIVP